MPKLKCYVCHHESLALQRVGGLCEALRCPGRYLLVEEATRKHLCAGTAHAPAYEGHSQAGTYPVDPLANYSPSDRHKACRLNERLLQEELRACQDDMKRARITLWAIVKSQGGSIRIDDDVIANMPRDAELSIVRHDFDGYSTFEALEPEKKNP